MNEVQVSLDDVGRVQLRRAGGDEGVYTLEAFWVQAAREYFQAERDEELGRCRRHHKPEPSSSVVFLHEDGVKQTPAERFASWLLERKASRQAAREYEARRCYPSSTRPNY